MDDEGTVDVYFKVFFRLGSWQIWISPSTENPSSDWTTQQGRNFQMHLGDNELKCETPMRDLDRKYSARGESLLRRGRIKPTRDAFEAALAISNQASERRFLAKKLANPPV